MKKFWLVALTLITITAIGLSIYSYSYAEGQIKQAQKDMNQARLDHIKLENVMIESGTYPLEGTLRNISISLEAPLSWKIRVDDQHQSLDNPFTFDRSGFSRTLTYLRVASPSSSSTKDLTVKNTLSLYDITNWMNHKYQPSENATEDDRRLASLGFNPSDLKARQAYLNLLQSFQDGHILTAEEREQILRPIVPAAHPAGIPFAEAVSTGQGKGIIYADIITQQIDYNPLLVVNIVQNVGPRVVFTYATIWTDDETSKRLKEEPQLDERGITAAIAKYKNGDFEPSLKAAIEEVISVIKTIHIDMK